jgi:cytidine deaminase
VIADGSEPVPPCGGCRQKLAEFAAPEVVVTMATVDGKTLPHDGGRPPARAVRG